MTKQEEIKGIKIFIKFKIIKQTHINIVYKIFGILIKLSKNIIILTNY